MKSNYFIGYSNDFNSNFEEKDNYLDVWKDVLIYSSNLQGNWGVSRQVFYESMVPTAEKDPAKFARWINELVKSSGIKIKSRAGFLKSLNYLRKLQKKNNKNEIKKALFSLFEAGLNEPLYALKALKNSMSSYQAG
ncbi:MAG: hypothetical protein WCG23_03725 [bacterium]